MTIELWKPVCLLPTMEDIHPSFLVSNLGRLRTKTGKISNTNPRKEDGYIRPTLYTEEGKRKLFFLHRLVALAFVDGYKEDLQVNHIDENKANNHFSNLEWTTAKENVNHGTRTERMAETRSQPVEALDPETGDCVLVFKSTQHAHEFGFNHGNVSTACRGVYNRQGKHGGTNKYKGFLWRYA